MITASLFVALSAHFAGIIDAPPAPIFTDVYLGSHGPFRFLIDTGAESSVIHPALAGKLGLKPEYRVEQFTLHGSRLVPALKASGLRIGRRPIPAAELMIHDIDAARRLDPAVDGILGANALASFDFTLSPSTKSLDDTTPRPVDGQAVPFQTIEGRWALKARMGAETLTLILDSGATNVVLFRVPAAMTKTHPVTATFSTIEGARSIVPTRWTADLFFGDKLRVGMLPAAIVGRSGSAVDGLLPASAFKKIYVDQSRRELVLIR